MAFARYEMKFGSLIDPSKERSTGMRCSQFGSDLCDHSDETASKEEEEEEEGERCQMRTRLGLDDDLRSLRIPIEDY